VRHGRNGAGPRVSKLLVARLIPAQRVIHILQSGHTMKQVGRTDQARGEADLKRCKVRRMRWNGTRDCREERADSERCDSKLAASTHQRRQRPCITA
jgi:hypothetical protein